MGRFAREAVAPAYLLLCLVLGGSAQGVWGNMTLELIGLAIVAWAATARTGEAPARPAMQLFLLLLAGLLLVLVQLVPLPASLWPHLGGRAAIADGYRILGLAVPPRPWSLAPYEGSAALVEIIPPLALLCAIVRLRAYRPGWLALALVAGTLAGVLLGALQAATAKNLTSPWYPYADSTIGVATGFFANANHMAMLMLVTIPFLAALLAAARGASMQRYSAAVALTGGMMLVIVVGIALNKSIAGYMLFVPVLGASALLLMPPQSRLMRAAALASAALLIMAIAFLASTPVGDRTLGTTTSVNSRATVMRTTLEAAGDFMPLGSGLGSFRGVYRLYEDHDRIERTYINHAHNDYLELALETGVPGIVLMVMFLLWWGRASWRAWQAPGRDAFAAAASIASAALLLHSAVEFPLRSIALSAVFGACLALIIARRAAPEADKSHLWPTRHVELK